MSFGCLSSLELNFAGARAKALTPTSFQWLRGLWPFPGESPSPPDAPRFQEVPCPRVRAVVARPLPLCLAFVFFSNLCPVVKARVTSAAFWSWGTISHECITNAALWCLEALEVNELGDKLWTSSLELCSVDIALDRSAPGAGSTGCPPAGAM